MIISLAAQTSSPVSSVGFHCTPISGTICLDSSMAWLLLISLPLFPSVFLPVTFDFPPPPPTYHPVLLKCFLSPWLLPMIGTVSPNQHRPFLLQMLPQAGWIDVVKYPTYSVAYSYLFPPLASSPFPFLCCTPWIVDCYPLGLGSCLILFSL